MDPYYVPEGLKPLPNHAINRSDRRVVSTEGRFNQGWGDGIPPVGIAPPRPYERPPPASVWPEGAPHAPVPSNLPTYFSAFASIPLFSPTFPPPKRAPPTTLGPLDPRDNPSYESLTMGFDDPATFISHADKGFDFQQIHHERTTFAPRPPPPQFAPPATYTLTRPPLEERTANANAVDDTDSSISAHKPLSGAVRSSPRKKGISSHHNDLSLYHASASAKSAREKLHANTKPYPKPDEVASGTHRQLQAAKNDRSESRESATASAASSQKTFVEESFWISKTSIGRGLVLADLKAPGMHRLYGRSVKRRFPIFEPAQWEARWAKLIHRSLSLREQVCTNYQQRLVTQAEQRKPHSSVSNVNGRFECAVPDCALRFDTEVEKYDHVFSHLPLCWFCPTCGELFKNRTVLEAHLKRERKCEEGAMDYHYCDHKLIFNSFFLGGLESFAIPEWFFEYLAQRQRGEVYTDEAISRARNRAHVG